jgi:RNA polymerase sigma factor (sigma-70 family)
MIKKYADDRPTLNKKLVEHNMTLVTSFIRQYRTQLDADDIFQEGILGLMDAVERFDITAKNKFSTYAYFYIKKYVNRLYKNNNQQFDGLTNGMVRSIHDTSSGVEGDDGEDRHLSLQMTGDHDTPLDHVSDKSNTLFIEKLINNMVTKGIITDNESFVMDGIYYKNKTKREIAKNMGISSSMVGNHYNNALRKMKKHLSANMKMRSMEDLSNV